LSPSVFPGPYAGGTGGGGSGSRISQSQPGTGTDGLGGGGGGATNDPGNTDGDNSGGDGIVILRMADGDAGTASGEDSTATNVGGSGKTVITWLSTSGGTYIP